MRTDVQTDRQAGRQAEGRTDLLKLVVAFRNFAIASKNKSESTFCLMYFAIVRAVLSLTVPSSPACPYDVSSIKMNLSLKHW
jgi:hypothetical protein